VEECQRSGTPVSILNDLASALSENIGNVSGGHGTGIELTNSGVKPALLQLIF
jgi:hypothetical protein